MLLISSSTTLLSSSSRLPIPARRRRSPNYKTNPNRITCSFSMDPITSLGRLLWGRSLPPSLFISTARSTWHATWHLFMRQLAPTSSSAGAGSYSRPASQFPTVPDSYLSGPRRRSSKLRLYAAHPSPWAHRTLIVLALTLNNAPPIQVSLAAPRVDGAWELDCGAGTLMEVYRTRKGGYDGRATVPTLWDEDTKEVVCNDSYGIIHFFNSLSRFENDDDDGMDLAPEELRGDIQRWNEIIYPNVNNGVYRCGFASTMGFTDVGLRRAKKHLMQQ